MSKQQKEKEPMSNLEKAAAVGTAGLLAKAAIFGWGTHLFWTAIIGMGIAGCLAVDYVQKKQRESQENGQGSRSYA